ncbi:hypothetical protein ABZ725_28900 [Streptomyces sp. NPDC006872]|uniref:hypothetical protein n=1 Tax=Streptomyces sp. NPDC006872 TaxID=3155720 RepID=UPI0033D558D1
MSGVGESVTAGALRAVAVEETWARPAPLRHGLVDAVLEGGFATVKDFLASARAFYLYDKAHPTSAAAGPPDSGRRRHPVGQ